MAEAEAEVASVEAEVAVTEAAVEAEVEAETRVAASAAPTGLLVDRAVFGVGNEPSSLATVRARAGRFVASAAVARRHVTHSPTTSTRRRKVACSGHTNMGVPAPHTTHPTHEV